MTIKQRPFGRTSLMLSELCLGTLNFGWKTDEKNSFAILDAYREAGGNFIQATGVTPELSLQSTCTSLSEEIVGRWLRSRGVPRDSLFLATRINLRPVAKPADFLAAVRQTYVDTLRRFQTDYLDLVVFEWHDSLIPIDVAMDGFDLAVRGSYARFIAAANFPLWRVSDTIHRAYRENHCRIEAIQTDYSLMIRARFEPEAMELCREQKLAFFARAPLAGGFFSARPAVTTPHPASVRQNWLSRRFANRYGETARAAVSKVAKRYEMSAPQVALSWVLDNPMVTSTIIGVQSPAQLHELIAASRFRMEAEAIELLNTATASEEIQLSPASLRSTPHRRLA